MLSSTFLKSISALSFLSLAYAGCSRNYTVVAGDVCDGISKSNSVSTFQLAISNNAVDDACSNLSIGQDLCLGWAGLDCTSVYVVKSGDTCDSVISSYSLNSTILYQNNPNIDDTCSNIYTGEVLCVSSVAYDYPEIVTVASETAPSYLAVASNYAALPFCD